MLHELDSPGTFVTVSPHLPHRSKSQALASLAYLQPHIDAIHTKAEAFVILRSVQETRGLEVPTPSSTHCRTYSAVRLPNSCRLLSQMTSKKGLSTPRSTWQAIRSTEIIEVLSTQTEGRTNSLFYSRTHQDAWKLFQVLSECIKNEIATVDKERHRIVGQVDCRRRRRRR